MRLNQFLATHTNLSRRGADLAIVEKRVRVNDSLAEVGQQVDRTDRVELDGGLIADRQLRYLIMNKPVGYITSRRKQDKSPTIYELLDRADLGLKPAGRLDKDSSGMLIMTNDGPLANQLTHPKYEKVKTYQVQLDRPLAAADRDRIRTGVRLSDGPSKLQVEGGGRRLTVKLSEGRNRQIRRSFGRLGYRVERLHRLSIGRLGLDGLEKGRVREVSAQVIDDAIN
jgi:23S rRNA pseudouridine2605 synthase